jgi:hypothetical protein
MPLLLPKPVGSGWVGIAATLPAVAKKGALASVSVRSEKSAQRAQDLGPTIRDLQASGASLREIAAALNARKIPTARGGEWSAVQLKRVLDRAAG